MNTVSAKIMLMNGDLDEKLAYLYACPIEEAVLHRERLINAIEKFEELFGVSREISIFSAPGRTEIGGNHTDHQLGRVLAASVATLPAAMTLTPPPMYFRAQAFPHPLPLRSFWAPP